MAFFYLIKNIKGTPMPIIISTIRTINAQQIFRFLELDGIV